MCHTDTEILATGIGLHDGTSPYEIEAISCEDGIRNRRAGGGVVSGNNQRNRIPSKPEHVCEVGKWMYFGLEDRPPQNQGGQGAPYPVGSSDPGGDRDYDNMRIVASRPV